MSGPYLFLYLLPSVRIPAVPEARRPEVVTADVFDWVADRYEILNADMRNAWTGAPCFSDNASVVNFTLMDLEKIRELPGLEGLPSCYASWHDLDRLERTASFFRFEEDGSVSFELSPDLAPESACAASLLADLMTDCAERVKAGDPTLMEILEYPVTEWSLSLDFAEFLPPERHAEVGTLAHDEDAETEESDEEILAAVGASVFATVAAHARQLAEAGADNVLLIDFPGASDSTISFDTNSRALVSPETLVAKKGWLSRLFGG